MQGPGHLAGWGALLGHGALQARPPLPGSAAHETPEGRAEHAAACEWQGRVPAGEAHPVPPRSRPVGCTIPCACCASVPALYGMHAKKTTFHRIMWWSHDSLRDPLALVQSSPHLGSSVATTT